MTSSFGSPESRWAAVQSRDPSATSAFVYAVRTTRIFCRPTCPARLARRANVSFFDTPDGAAQAGFRPCKRCKPCLSDPTPTLGKAKAAVERAQTIMISTRGSMTWAEVCKDVKVSPRYLHNVFSATVGITPGIYARLLRDDETMVQQHDKRQPDPGLDDRITYAAKNGDEADFMCYTQQLNASTDSSDCCERDAHTVNTAFDTISMGLGDYEQDFDRGNFYDIEHWATLDMADCLPDLEQGWQLYPAQQCYLS
ncbi:hypothetical protein FH972_024290 [Carpinus fangiana]|uniref:Ada DNA repair metal-binding domain-containing protein n=1 Tax=Carpinus fangiana TaxID=176857 RepID=A0A5N6KY09_9ROSI|nr:hypothetical protein FH972_024290 [Carpinus fangiana]